jgi:hypothetical protein
MNAIKQCALEDGFTYPAALAALEVQGETKPEARG